MTLEQSRTTTPSAINTVAALAPIVSAVFLGFLALSFPLGALSIEIGHRLGFGTVVVGTVIGLQSFATLLTRHKAGGVSDHRGPRFAVLWGLPIAALSGVFYILSDVAPVGAIASLAFLILGQISMGLGQSLFLTGLMSWGIGRLGASRTGNVMSWTGIAIYAALAVGAPLGLAIQNAYGFAGVGLVTMVTPLIATVISALIPGTPASGQQRVPFHLVIGLIWKPGMVLALATVPFAAMEAFLPLYYADHGWSEPGSALFGFGVAYIFVRLVASDFPDRFGAAAVAIGSLLLEGLGQMLLWLAPVSWVAVAGAAVTGLGFSLIFPSMGILATRSVSPSQRGRAVGNFIAFSDIALGVTGPAIGVVSLSTGFPAAFLIGACASCTAVLLLPSVGKRNAS